MKGLPSLLSTYIDKNIYQHLNETEIEEYNFLFLSLIKSVLPCLLLSIVLYLFNMQLAALLFFIAALYFIVAFLIFPKIIPQKIAFKYAGSFTSFLIITINFIVLGYYGFSYGGQYILLISILIALVNTKQYPKHRKAIYAYVAIGMCICAAILFINGPMVPPAKYGNIINLVMLAITFMIVYSFAETYVKLLANFETERHAQLTNLKIKNEEFKTFNHSVAHDLKEPLRSIAGFSNLLFKNVDVNKKEESEEYKNYIDKSVNRMSSLLEDLLRYIETSNNALIEEQVDLNKALQFAEENLTQQIKDKDAQIEKGKLPSVKGNMNFVVLLFQNLISNAMKFVKDDVKPKISIQSTKLDDGVSIQFKDNGIGVAEGNLEKIFEAFGRGNSKNEYEGSGLGLSLCKKIITKMQGEIKVKTTSNIGTTFEIFLPNKVLLF